ncbi:MAG: N-acetylglucosamine-6-phosphate deacetylase [Acetobacteraceae bacterium]
MHSAGLFDLQVNGYCGVDFNDATITAEAMDHALAAMLRAGVTHCLPTIITAPAMLLAERLGALDRAVAGARLRWMVPGYHLEGPFLCPEDGYAGCHPADAMVAPDPALVEQLEKPLHRPLLLITLAPERPGAAALIRWARAGGKVVALGHTAATGADVALAAEAGATLSTHLGNGLKQTLPKFDNPLIAQLAEDRLSASFIADGIHLPPVALKVMLRAKGLDRGILVTDATAAAAAPAGQYTLAGMAIERTDDGAVRLPGRHTLAGSALTLDQAVRNIVTWGLASAEQAVRLAGANPAALMAPAFAAHGITLQPTTLEWSGTLVPHVIDPPI